MNLSVKHLEELYVKIRRQIFQVRLESANVEKTYSLKYKFSYSHTHSIALGSLGSYCQIKRQTPEEKTRYDRQTNLKSK